MVLRRSLSKSVRPGEWEFPGGKVDFGESFEQAGIRELEEETGLLEESLELLQTFSFVKGDRHAVGVLYRIELEAKPAINLSDEHQDSAWVNESNWHEYAFTEQYKEFFKKYFNQEDDFQDETDNLQKTMKKNQQYNSSKFNGHYKKLVIFADGGSRGNPGPSATGFVIYDSEKSEIEKGGEYLGVTTNNQAEYLAVKQALIAAQKYEPSVIEFNLDSQLVVNQMNGTYKVRNKDLWPVHESIKELMSQFEKVSFSHVKREFNKEADAMANQVLDEHEQKEVESNT